MVSTYEKPHACAENRSRVSVEGSDVRDLDWVTTLSAGGGVRAGHCCADVWRGVKGLVTRVGGWTDLERRLVWCGGEVEFVVEPVMRWNGNAGIVECPAKSGG